MGVRASELMDALENGGEGLDLSRLMPGGEEEQEEKVERGHLVGDDQAPTYKTAALELTPEEEAALLALLKEIERADDNFRLEEIRPAAERREAFNGNQLVAWDPSERRYVDVLRELEKEAEPDQDLPSFHRDNFYTPYGLDFIALMIASPIQTSFAPGDSDSPKDVIAAEEGERLVEWVNKQTDSLTIRRWLGYYFWNDGFGSIYTRMRADRAEYGYETEPEIVLEEQETRPPGMRCAFCTGISPVGSPACVDCGSPLDFATPVPAERGMVPTVSRMVEIPKAGVKKSAHGILEVRRTPGARLVRECGYLILAEDIPKAHALALYPDKGEELTKTSSGSVAEEYEASARRGLVYGSDRRTDHLVTYKRAWLRPWQFEGIHEEDVKRSLREKAPDGVLMVTVGDTLCEALAESMDDHWTFRFTFPGHGAGVIAAGSSVWDLQQSANELLNLRIEGARQGIPAMIVNNDVLDPEAFAAGRLQPGLIYQAKTPGDGGSLRDAVVPTPVASLPAEVGNLEKELGAERAQHRSGIVAALWGGQSGGAGRTLGGYRLQRDQGLMRHGIPWKELEAISNESDLQAVRLYARDGYHDVEVSTRGEGGEWGKDVISIDSLDGEIRIESDDDSGFPMGPAERRAAWFEYLSNGGLAPMLMAPENESTAAENLGISDLKFPGQDAREAQRREIEELLTGEPILDPMTGQAMPTVQVDVELENHEAHLAAIDLWANSRDGAKTRLENPGGWENVKAHWRAHLMARTQKSMVMQQAAMPPMPMGAPMGGPPPGGAPPAPSGPPIVREEAFPMTGPGQAPGVPIGAPAGFA